MKKFKNRKFNDFPIYTFFLDPKGIGGQIIINVIIIATKNKEDDIIENYRFSKDA